MAYFSAEAIEWGLMGGCRPRLPIGRGMPSCLSQSLMAAAVIVVTLPAAGQNASAPKPAFDAASVKLDKSGSSSSEWNDHPGRMTVKDGTLRALIERAYSLQAHQIVGPGWLAYEHYDIEAEMPASTTRAERTQMIQSLLAERFGLSFHREQKVLPVYLLVAAKRV